jgi:hemerythrin-like domain-containing protein
MQPDKLLGTDPDCIARALGAFELYIDEIERKTADPRDFDRFVTLLDRVVEPHCAREEALLLAAMAVGGVAAGAEELSEARVRRLEAREVLRALEKGARDSGTLGHPRSVTQRARNYVDLVRGHLGWYRRVVRPLLESRLSPDQTDMLGEGDMPRSDCEQAELEALVEAYSERPTPVQPAQPVS